MPYEHYSGKFHDSQSCIHLIGYFSEVHILQSHLCQSFD